MSTLNTTNATTMTRILITGSRDWDCEDLAKTVIAGLIRKHGSASLVIVHGDCPTGVDAAFDKAATNAGLRVERHKAQWDVSGPAAGPMRNTMMVRAGADVCLAFTKDLLKSQGTKDCALKAHSAGIPTWVVGANGVPNKLVTK